MDSIFRDLYIGRIYWKNGLDQIANMWAQQLLKYAIFSKMVIFGQKSTFLVFSLPINGCLIVFHFLNFGKTSKFWPSNATEIMVLVPTHWVWPCDLWKNPCGDLVGFSVFPLPCTRKDPLDYSISELPNTCIIIARWANLGDSHRFLVRSKKLIFWVNFVAKIDIFNICKSWFF